MKKLIILGTAAALAGCTAQQVEQGTIDSLFVDETIVSQDNKQNYMHKLVALANGSPVIKIVSDDANGVSRTEFVAGNKFNLGGFEGSAEIIGAEDSENNSGAGINARGTAGNHTFGVALEKSVDANVHTVMPNVYAMQKIPLGTSGFIEVTEGYVDTNGDGQGIFVVSYTKGNGIVGVGTRGNDDSRVSTAVLGRFNSESNKGTAGKIWGRVDQDGNHFVDLTVAIGKGKIVRPQIAAMVSPDNGCLEPGLIENWFDAHSYRWTYGNGLIVHAKHSNSDSGIVNLLDTIYHFHKEGELFVPRVFASYKKEDEIESGEIGVGGSWENSYFDLGINVAEEEKPALKLISGSKIGF